MKTSDIKKYRKDYYHNNRKYLIDYQKWYYSKTKCEKGQLHGGLVKPKPIRCNRKYITKNDPDYIPKPKEYLEIQRGNFTIIFD